MSTLKTSEVLDLAADLIQERGWTTGSYGWPLWEESMAPLCLEGGIMAALGFASMSPDNEAFRSCPAYWAVQDYLDTDGPLWLWNDAGHTAAEVIEVLRAAAAVERVKEESLVAA